jgi:hypothetical protein
MPVPELPSLADVMSFGSAHNPTVWMKHRAILPDPSRLDAVLEICHSKTGKLSRQHVFDIADDDASLGVIASIVWGFPRGGRPGGKWMSFAEAFEASPLFAEVLARLKTTAIPATEGIGQLNRVIRGIGFATTSKMAYFARLVFSEGPALIYDANVIKAITAPKSQWADAFSGTRSALGTRNFYPKATPSYGNYVCEASTYAARRNTVPDVVEVALFRETARPGVWG